MPACQNCGLPIEASQKRGPARRFCSDRCRKAASRRAPLAAVTVLPSNGDSTSDDYVKDLCRQRDLLWELLDAAPAGSASSLSRELRMVRAELEAIYGARTATGRPSAVDHLRARREARLAGLPPPPCPPELGCNHSGASS